MPTQQNDGALENGLASDMAAKRRRNVILGIAAASLAILSYISIFLKLA